MRADERGICLNAARLLRSIAAEAEKRGDDDWLYRNQPTMSAYMRGRTRQSPGSAISRCEQWSKEGAELWPGSRVVHGYALARRASTVRSAVLSTHTWIEGPDGREYDPSWRQYRRTWQGRAAVERRADLVRAPFVVPVMWPEMMPPPWCHACHAYRLDGERCLCGVGLLGYVEHYVGRIDWLAALEACDRPSQESERNTSHDAAPTGG